MNGCFARIAAAGISACVSFGASAADAAAQCTLIQDNELRLACFDKVYGTQMPGQTLPGQTVEPKSSVDLVQTVADSVSKKEVVWVMEPADAAARADSGGAGGRIAVSQDLIDAAEAYTPLSQMFDLDQNDERGLLSVREHNPMYLMPAWYNSSPNYYPSSPTRGVTSDEKFFTQKRLETKMQVSFKTKLAQDLFSTRADIWFGYTQKSDWQIYNQGRESAPFRNSDYSPEIFITQPVKAALPGGGRLRVLGAGFVHQSNGQSRPQSRSWNRIYAFAGMEWGRLTVIPRLWLPVFKENGSDNDNPDINDYMGYGDLKLQYRFNDKQTVGTVLRYNPKTGKGAVEAGYSFPMKGKLKLYVRGFHGYGESLIDYNRKQTGIGIGVMFNDWDGL